MEVVELTKLEKSLVEKIFSEISKHEGILTPERKRQILAKVLRKTHPFSSLDYLELIVLVEDSVSEEQKAALKNACESFARRINLQSVNPFLTRMFF